jgi:uncharacterized protein
MYYICAMIDKILGRKLEQKELRNAYESLRPEMVALVGRRRVGKTFLIRQAYAGLIRFEVTGLQHGGKTLQIDNFLISLSKFFPDFVLKETPKTWLRAFHLLSQLMEPTLVSQKQVVFIDELPWMDTPKSGFITGLSWFWNSWASTNNVVIVICGSSASWMIDKVINDKGGLHNRVTRYMILPPFSLSETEAFCVSRNINLPRYHLLQIYMTMGGIPMYLDQLKPGLSAMQNIGEVCFSAAGFLKNEFDRLFTSLFSNPASHLSVIRALATKRKGLTRNEIVSQAKLTNNGSLTVVLDELEKSGFISIVGGFGKVNKDSLFRLYDPYCLFYLTFIEPLGKNAQVTFSQLSDLPEWKTWCGYAFENVCMMHIEQIRQALGISGMFTKVASFVSKASDSQLGAQIDLVIERNDQSIHICEMKFSATPFLVQKSVIESIEKKKMAFLQQTGSQKHLFTTLIAPFGIVENSNSAQIDQVITADELFV